MAGQLTIDTLKASTGVLATQNGMTGVGKAWCNFDGTTGTIRAAFNVSSITKNSTGNYTANFTTAMPDANYSFIGTTSPSTGITDVPRATLVLSYGTAPTTTTRRFFTGDTANANFQDCAYVNIAVLGN